MTTLPQSTSPRDPRVTGLAPLAPVLLQAPAGSGLPAGVSQMTGADVWRIIRAHLWLIILLAILGTGAGYALNYVLSIYAPKYTATGWLQIMPPPNLSPLSPGGDVDMLPSSVVAEQRTQAAQLTTEAMFTNLMQQPAVRNTRWWAEYGGDPRRAREYLRENISVAPVPESFLVRLNFTYGQARDCATIIEELVKLHLEQQTALAFSRFDSRTKALNQLRSELANNITTLENRIRNAQANLIARGMGTKEIFFSTKEKELGLLIDAQLRLANDAAEAQSMYERVAALVAAGEKLPEVERAIESDQNVFYLVQSLTQTRILRELELGRKLPDHPDIKELDRRLDLTEAELARRREELRIRFRDQFVETLRSSATQARANLEAINARLEALKADLGDRGREASELLALQAQLSGLQEQKAAADARFRDISASSATQRRIEWLPGGRPEIPEIPTFPNIWAFLSGGLFTGIALALGIGFLREWLNDTVRSPRDLARLAAGGEHINVLGTIADESDDPQLTGGAGTSLAIFDAPQSLTAEQFRQLRTRLQYAAPFESLRALLITGPSPATGKTTVAANLAAGLALAGRKVLLVDANFRRPELHNVFGLANGRGFADVLNGTAPLAEAAQTTRVPNLHLLASGPKPLNATELFESQLLTDFLKSAAAEYDHIVFDSGPLLVVSEAAALAARVDGVVTVVRAHLDSRGKLQRLREELRKVRAEHLGVVLNAVRARGGGYYGRNIRLYYDYQ